MADRIAVMHDGRVQQVDTPVDLYHQPANTFVADFIGSSNSFAGTRTDDGVDVPGLGVLPGRAGDIAPGDAAVLVVRPEDISLVAAGEGRLAGTVLDTQFYGGRSTIAVEVAGHASPVTVTCQGTAHVAPRHRASTWPGRRSGPSSSARRTDGRLMTQPSIRTADALRDAVPRPFWTDRADAPAPAAPLSGGISCDVLVVGGGLTGLWAAIEARAERPVRRHRPRGGRDHRLRRIRAQRRLLLRVADPRHRPRRGALARGPADAAASRAAERARDRRLHRERGHRRRHPAVREDRGRHAAPPPRCARSGARAQRAPRRGRHAPRPRGDAARRRLADVPRRTALPHRRRPARSRRPSPGGSPQAARRRGVRIHESTRVRSMRGGRAPSRSPRTRAASARAASCWPPTPTRRCCVGSGTASCPSTTTCS